MTAFCHGIIEVFAVLVCCMAWVDSNTSQLMMCENRMLQGISGCWKEDVARDRDSVCMYAVVARIPEGGLPCL
jgi:hypothetical protein